MIFLYLLAALIIGASYIGCFILGIREGKKVRETHTTVTENGKTEFKAYPPAKADEQDKSSLELHRELNNLMKYDPEKVA